jgi:hypothetical protein
LASPVFSLKSTVEVNCNVMVAEGKVIPKLSPACVTF